MHGRYDEEKEFISQLPELLRKNWLDADCMNMEHSLLFLQVVYEQNFNH
jgi:hypothetical protein